MPYNSPASGTFTRKLQTLFRRLWRMLLGRFISFVGELSQPGEYPFCLFQAWALRRMGVTCPSNEIWIGPRTRFDNPEYVVLGNRVQIGPDSRITGWATVTFGDDFMSGPALLINTGSHDLVTLKPEYQPVTFGARVWCGMRVSICCGVTIGDDAVIGASALVTRSIPAKHLAMGVPCRPVREIERPAPNAAAPLWTPYDPKKTGVDRERIGPRLTRLLPQGLKRSMRRVLWRSPALYAPLGWFLQGRSVRKLDFDCWLDGFPRSGNTFAAKALRLSLPGRIILRSHTHHPAYIRAAVQAGKPGIFVLRRPADAVTSWAIYSEMPIVELLDYYIDFHQALLGILPQMFVAVFEDFSNDIQPLLGRFFARHGLESTSFHPTTEEIFQLIERDNISARGAVSEMTIHRPSKARDVLKRELVQQLETASAQARLREAQALYERFIPPAALVEEKELCQSSG